MMKTYKFALLAALGLAGFNVHAQTIPASYSPGDLVIGIYEPADANTLEVDLGSASSILSSSYSSWNLASYLTTAGITLNAASSVYGVVGATGAQYPATAYSTGVFTPALTGSKAWSTAQVAAISTDVNSIGSFLTAGNGAAVLAAGSGYDWYYQSIQTPPNANSLASTVLGLKLNTAVGNPEVLYASTGKNGATPAVKVTGLTFDLTPGGELTYGVVPEPSTYGLIAGAGMILIALRKQFAVKKA